MAKNWWTSLISSRLAWPLMVVLAVGDAAGLYMLTRNDAAQVPPRRVAAPKPPVPKAPPQPAMIEPPPVATVLQSGTLIVISKKSQNMFVFSDGQLWASTPVSTGKRRHATPSGVFPILQKRRHHRSNIYSNAPMPFMQRLTWSGIALHAGYVPGYPASHGCIRLPRAFAQSLFKLTNASRTTVVIGDDPMETEAGAQQFALTANLKVHSALAPLADPKPVAPPAVKLAAVAVAPTPPPIAPPPSRPNGGQTIQLTAAASQADAEAHWARLLSARPDLRRFEKTVEAAVVNARQVYRLRMSGPNAHEYCAKLKREGISCLNIS
jgi:lipoprotein-anchoring transpeptidase ErfK/SrfK